MKTLIISLLLLFAINTYSQYGETYIDVLILPYEKACKLYNRYERAGFTAEFYIVDETHYLPYNEYVLVLEEMEEQTIISDLFYIRYLIPKRYWKYIQRWDLTPIKLKSGGHLRYKQTR